MSFRNWCFTLNNYTESEVNEFENWCFRYLIYGIEVGESGTPHIQGYIELDKKVRMSAMKKLNNKIHWETRMGTQEQAVEYCKKEGNWKEFGNLKNQGERTDLCRIRQMALDEGLTAVTRVGTMQQINVAKIFLTYNEEPRDWKPEVTWIYGPSGKGKSKLAREILDSEDIYVKNSGTKWWARYDNHEDVIIDDFRDTWWELTEMLSLLDRYEKVVEYKGGERQFRAKRIVITSIKHPRTCYRDSNEDIEQLLRRIDKIINIESVPSQKSGG